MGYIPAKGFTLFGGKTFYDADRVINDPGYEGEWVTLVNRSSIDGREIRFHRRGRPIFATKKEAVAWARENMKHGLM